MTTTPPARASRKRKHVPAERDTHIVNNAVYEGGKRIATPSSLAETFETLDEASTVDGLDRALPSVER